MDGKLSTILAWKAHGQRNLLGYSPRVCKELNTTERLRVYWRTIMCNGAALQKVPICNTCDKEEA